MSAPEVIFDNLGESTIDFTLYFWVDADAPGLLGGTSAGVKAIKAAFAKAGVDMPFPTRVLRVKRQAVQSRPS